MAALLFVAAQGQSQQPSAPLTPAAEGSSPTYTLQINARAVLLDVVVTDKDGKTIPHLSSPDFTVYEDNVQQRIRSFDETAASTSAGPLHIDSTAQLDREAPDAPVSIIVLDEVTSRFTDLAYARYSLERYLQTQGVDTLQQPAMLMSVDYRNMHVLRDYTTSRKEILDALNHHLAGNTTAMQTGSFGNEEVRASFGSLLSVARASAGHHGHKNLIWIGRGMPTIGETTLTPEAIVQFRDIVALTTNALRNARVTLYTIDPAGLEAFEPQDSNGLATKAELAGAKLDASNPFARNFSFNTIAFATGGRTFLNRNDVDAMIDTAVRDGQNFYTLSYVPTSSADTAKSFRNIRIVMKDHRLKASTRQGYFDMKTDYGTVNAHGNSYSRLGLVDINLAAMSLLVYDGVPLKIAHDGSAADLFHINMTARDLPVEIGDTKKPISELTVVAESFDAKGKMLDHSAALFKVHLPESSSDAVSLPIHIVTADAARLRFIVRADATGKIGAENFFFVDPSKLTDPATGLNYHMAK